MSMSPDPQSVPTYRLYRERTGESADFWLHSETIPVRSRLHNWQISIHRHDALFQMFLVTAGGGTLLCDGGEGDGESRPIAAPSVLFIPPGAAHGFRFTHDVDGLVVTALADRLRSLAAADRAIAAYVAEPRVTALAGSRDGDIAASCIRRIHAEIGSRAAGRAVLIDALVTQAIVSMARAGAETSGVAPGPASRGRMLFERFEVLIEAHFREHRPVAFYAARLGISAPHLNRLCRREAGMSPQAMMARRLIEAARRELVFTPTPIQVVAFGLGFRDAAYFNRFFRKMTGTTPGAYRRSKHERLAG